MIGKNQNDILANIEVYCQKTCMIYDMMVDEYYFDVIRMSTIEDILKEQRKKTTINVQALSNLLYTPEQIQRFKLVCTREPFHCDFNIFNKSRVDLIKESMKIVIPSLVDRENNEWDTLAYILRTHVQLPYTIHYSMFMKCLEIMGTEAQQEEWFKKALRGEIIGCYAQTQLGHGSDVQNLQTTATYIMENDTFVMSTPSISAAKFWPGDLGIFATHALVFAQMIVQGQKHGVHAFIVPIRDVQTLKPLPGIQVGDIGPKIGFETKDNGYLLMKNIVIPKSNMLRRFISVSKQGEIKTKGDPKVSYATMMIIRQTISCFYPKIYSEAIIIATRYSLFRKQFLNVVKKEIPVIDYQSQKEKIIPRVAEYFAVTLGGNAIKKLTDKNLKLVKQKNDFSLMAQSHVCLCAGKALFSEIVYDGMETLRKACGGHGFSHYSGIPNLLNEYVSNITLEGENTILYLQISRYLLKNYKYAMTQKKPVGESVKYLLNFGEILSSRVDNDRSDWEKWNLSDLQLLLKQATCHSISLITQKMMNKPQGMSQLDLWNKVAGVEVKRAAVSHCLLYTFIKFKEAIQLDTTPINKQILNGLCRLFGANTILSHSIAITEGGYILPAHITGLIRLKEKLLEEIRPNLVAILDSFLIPEGYLRSAFAKGNPYDNFLQLARNCELNKQVIEAAFKVRNNIQRVIKMHQSKL